MKPENIQTYLPAFGKGIRKGIHFFPYRDFICLYDRIKRYVPDLWLDLYRNSIITVLQTLNKSLFLFYGKRLLFCSYFRLISGKCIFHDKGQPEYMDRYSNMPEWCMQNINKEVKKLEWQPQISGKSSEYPGWLLMAIEAESGNPESMPIIIGTKSGNPERLPVTVGIKSGNSESLPVTAGIKSGSPERLPVTVGIESESIENLPVLIGSDSEVREYLSVTGIMDSNCPGWASTIVPCLSVLYLVLLYF